MDQLNEVEARILGSLMEKSLSTPEYYPLSLNALVNACNQKSSRDPVTDFDEATVQAALDSLCQKGIVFQSKVSRVPKYEEHFSRARQLVPKESAVLSVLLLRGPQTVGELRGRTSRMYTFANLEEVAATLENLMEWELARQQERLPGHKEARFCQLLSKADEDVDQPISPLPEEVGPQPSERLDKMEQTLEALQSELENLKQAFTDFKKQFE
jgi:hypothetical protein